MPLIETKNLYKIYDMGEEDQVHALDDVSISIESGEFVAIMGPSGSGKSTFMNTLGCLDRPTKGTYLLDGIDTGSLESNDLAAIRNKKIGFVFQGFNLLRKTTALGNVELPMLYAGVPQNERKKRSMAALHALGLSDRSNYFSNQLSGGQQQRVAIARALVNNAPLILADEPTGNLDSRSSYEIMDLIVKLNKEEKITIVLVTHEPDIAAYSRRIIKFLDGKVISDKVQDPGLKA
jgi:putative ABC transport system ATP-binding protein